MTPDQLEVRHQTAELPGVRLHYVERGSGPVVLLLHGFPETWWSWRYQIEPLAAAGYRVIAPDLRGYGESSTDGPFDLDTLAQDLVALIAHLGEQKVHVIGHDWGGALSWHFAAYHPELIRSLSINNCPHPAQMRDAFLRSNFRQLRRSWYMFFFLLPGIPEWLLTRNDAGNLERVLRASSVDSSHFQADEVRPFRDAIQRPGTATSMIGWYRTNLRRALKAPPYPAITVDTQLIWGLGDQALGFDDLVPGTDKLAPKLTVKTIENAGHFVHAEVPDQVNPLLIEFLRAHPS